MTSPAQSLHSLPTDVRVPASTSQTKLTQYFPVRRSIRKPRAEVQAQRLKSIEEKLLSDADDELSLRVVHLPGKGRGVVAMRRYSKGDFVVEYSGDLISIKTAKQRESLYSTDLGKGCYMYYFKCNNKPYCIDATKESGRLGRLVNHSKHSPNLLTKVVSVKQRPRLILVAKRDIEAGDELLYDYGDRSRDSVAAHPWLAL